MMPGEASGGNARTAVLVLGMHRSGTSALAGVLAHMGCATPLTQIQAGTQNPRGFFESRRVARLDDRILGTCGSSWHDWRPLQLPEPSSPEGSELRAAAADLIEEEFAGAEVIVLKDPRICRLVPVWSDALDRLRYRPVLLLTHRRPFDVARSLEVRNGFPPSFGLLLWLRYVLDAERLTRGRPRVFTSYDRVLADWRGVIGAIGTRLGVVFPQDVGTVDCAVDEFLSADLRHFAAAPGPGSVHPVLREQASGCFAIMERWASDGEDARDYEALDRMAATLAEAGWAYVDLPGAVDRQVEPLEAQLEALRTQIEEAAERRSVTERLLADAQGGLAEASVRLAEVSVRNRDLEEECDRQTDELASLARLLHEAEDQLQSAEQRFRAVIESSSWRVTAPMRRVADRLRGA